MFEDSHCGCRRRRPNRYSPQVSFEIIDKLRLFLQIKLWQKYLCIHSFLTAAKPRFLSQNINFLNAILSIDFTVNLTCKKVPKKYFIARFLGNSAKQKKCIT